MVPSGLFIVTARHEDQTDAVLASWVNQCAFDPPAITIVLSKLRGARLVVEASNRFVLNILAKKSNHLIKHFVKPPAGDIFKGVKTEKGFHGISVLKEALSYLECEITETVSVGDHVLYVGKVVGGKSLSKGEPYIHVRDDGFNY